MVTTDFGLAVGAGFLGEAQFPAFGRAFLISLLMVLLRLAIRCSHSVSKALPEGWRKFCAAIGVLKIKHGGFGRP